MYRYLPGNFFGFAYSKLSGNSLPSGCTKVTPDSFEITSEVLLVFKDPVDDFDFLIGATDMLDVLNCLSN